MSSILDDDAAPAKILLIGKSGSGKTGSLASLVASSYNLRIIDTDKGIRPLRSLLTDPHYPYAKLIAARGIDLRNAVRYVNIDTSMRLRTVIKKVPGEGNKTTSERLLAPVDAAAWAKVIDLLTDWKEDDGTSLGPVDKWSPNDILVLDSFSTLAKAAYYFSQSMNGRLGARDSGYDYQRDVGEAQSQLTRLLELLYDSNVGCNVIVISHITWVDESQGVASRPKESSSDGKSFVISNPDGYPSAIGRALSPQMGKYFNDVYVVASTGSGYGVNRTISSVPREGVVAKHSVWLESEYPITYGLGEIFARLRNQPLPDDLISAFKNTASAPTSAPQTSGGVTIRPKSAVAAGT